MMILALLLCTAPAQGGAPAPGSGRAPPALSVDRAVLDELLAVDTSHGNETRALEPVQARLRAAGLESQILESSPGRGNLIARIRGAGKARPLLLLAHIDVVPVEGQPWKTDPFHAVEKDGFLTARGVGDDKAMAAAIVAVALELQQAKTPLSRDVIIALTAGEETGGFAGVRWLVEKHRDLIAAEIALNEGGQLRLAPDSSRIEAVELGVAEKSFQSFRLVARGPGGHSSMPPTDEDPVLELSRALVKIGELRFRAHVLPEVREQLRASAQGRPEPLASALRRAAGTSALTPEDERVLAQDRALNALVRTTCVTTQLLGAPQDNVLPTTAEATVNCRILPDETVEDTARTLRRAIGDDRLELKPTESMGPGGASPVESEVQRAVQAVSTRLWGAQVVVTPSMSTGASDSRYLRQAGVRAYGIGTAPQTRDDVSKGYGAHGANERRAVRWLPEGTRFLREVVRELVR